MYERRTGSSVVAAGHAVGCRRPCPSERRLPTPCTWPPSTRQCRRRRRSGGCCPAGAWCPAAAQTAPRSYPVRRRTAQLAGRHHPLASSPAMTHVLVVSPAGPFVACQRWRCPARSKRRSGAGHRWRLPRRPRRFTAPPRRVSTYSSRLETTASAPVLQFAAGPHAEPR
jgi:hypothetical protein